MSRSIAIRVSFLSVAISAVFSSTVVVADDVPIFEKDIQPIFAAKCGKCHGEKAMEANLDLRTMAAMKRGGDSGSAINIKEETQSLLIERIDSGEMPPEDEPSLSKKEISLIKRWLKTGATSASANPTDDAWTQRLKEGKRYWAFQPLERPAVPGAAPKNAPEGNRKPIDANHESLRPNLQAWFRAESISLKHGERIKVWQDESGNERNLQPTWQRVDSQVGAPPRFMTRSTIGGHAAVRFNDIAGLGSPANNPVEIQGDAAWTITAVVNIRPPGQNSHTSVLVGFGDPAPGYNPGRPLASLLEIRRDQAFLSHSGGYGHDARLQPQSMWPLYDQPLVITLIKQPGSMTETTTVFINGQQIQNQDLSGVSTSPNIGHRSDFSLYMGRANGSLGAFRGEVAEVAVFNTALDQDRRASLESGLLQKYDIPPAISKEEDEHPVDAFINQKLKSVGLASAPIADRRTLIRRAYFDLIGLPPSPEEVEAFVNDSTPRAWERVIERLLNSKHYGERWGRHWLDVARYADTGGYETDVYYRNAWRFRDYVVKSFNDDKPYDRFVQEQIAGDELWPDNLDLAGGYVMDPEKFRHFEALTGTGFYALGTLIHESNLDAKKRNHERLTDWVDTTASAFLGLTFGCARCHDHKFDPISQRDYYSLQAAFAGSRKVEVPIQHGMGLADWNQNYPKVIAIEEAKMAYRHYESQTAGRARTPEEQTKLQQLKNAIADQVLALPTTDAQRVPYVGLYERPTITALAPHRKELMPEVRLLSRGELTRPKQKMEPALPGILSEQTNSKAALTPGPVGSRKEFALWLTRSDHPLTARVMVNRIWQWHFGRGIVATPNDFGKMGVAPSHPELLDWLSAEFVDRGWSIKSMHRLIMTSQAYQRSSTFFTENHDLQDPNNTLLWRMNRRRLEGEAVWDSVHSVAGTINLAMGGRPVMPPLLAEELTNKSMWVPSKVPAHHTRRGIYIIVRRNFNFPLFELFDAPVNAVSCSGRDVSTVAPQALWLLNNHLGFNQAKNFAARLVRDVGMEPEAQIKRAWHLALGRPATANEVAEALELLNQLEKTDPEGPSLEDTPAELAKLQPNRAAALTKLCLTLFNLNEFLYVD